MTDRYMTIPETDLAHAARHLTNAHRHRAEGRPEYARGSARKALRWIATARKLHDFLTPSVPFPEADRLESIAKQYEVLP